MIVIWYNKFVNSEVQKKFIKYNDDVYVNAIALFGAMISLIVNYKHYGWLLNIVTEMISNPLVIAFIGVFSVALFVLLLLLVLFFAIIGFYLTKLLCILIFSIIKQ